MNASSWRVWGFLTWVALVAVGCTSDGALEVDMRGVPSASAVEVRAIASTCAEIDVASAEASTSLSTLSALRNEALRGRLPAIRHAAVAFALSGNCQILGYDCVDAVPGESVVLAPTPVDSITCTTCDACMRGGDAGSDAGTDVVVVDVRSGEPDSSACPEPGVGDTDTDGDGIPDIIECDEDPCTDTNENGTPDYCDLDSDGDGLLDEQECLDTGCTGDPLPFRTSDSDGDGLLDAAECQRLECPVGTLVCDADGDGLPNHLDVDSDGDGINDDVECTEMECDFDGDMVCDHMDFDSDGDGALDVYECPDTECSERTDPGLRLCRGAEVDSFEENGSDCGGCFNDCKAESSCIDQAGRDECIPPNMLTLVLEGARPFGSTEGVRVSAISERILFAIDVSGGEAPPAMLRDDAPSGPVAFGTVTTMTPFPTLEDARVASEHGAHLARVPGIPDAEMWIVGAFVRANARHCWVGRNEFLVVGERPSIAGTPMDPSRSILQRPRIRDTPLHVGSRLVRCAELQCSAPSTSEIRMTKLPVEVCEENESPWLEEVLPEILRAR